MTGIEWTDETWNPSTGCTKISPGCKHCYAETMARRLHKMGQKKYRNVFTYTEHEDALKIPYKWKKPRMIFVNSMSDMFHEDCTFEFVAKCFDVMRNTPQHTYQVLTKRPFEMMHFTRTYDVPDNVWLGTSIENREAYENRIWDIRLAKCRTRFVSFEPLLEDLGSVDLHGIDWAIIGGESGRYHRPMDVRWVRNLIMHCKYWGVPVFFKQWGGDRPGGDHLVDGVEYREFPHVCGQVATLG